MFELQTLNQAYNSERLAKRYENLILGRLAQWSRLKQEKKSQYKKTPKEINISKPE